LDIHGHDLGRFAGLKDISSRLLRMDRTPSSSASGANDIMADQESTGTLHDDRPRLIRN
jgi:hypothetical protein